MRSDWKIILAVVVLATALAGLAAANMTDSDEPITGPALTDASEAAIAHLGGGTVTDTEVGDEDGFYEVEVTLDDGSQIDVHLREDFSVIGAEADDDSVDDED